MAEETGIAWTDSTFNAWIGCTKVGPGCEGCYAHVLDARYRWGGAAHWGAGVPRHRTSPGNWHKPIEWNARAAKTGKRWLVFCSSLSDVFDNEAQEKWRADLFALIRATPALTWQDNDRQQPVHRAHRPRLFVLALFEEPPRVFEHSLTHDLRAVRSALGGARCPRYAARLPDLTLVLLFDQCCVACCVPRPALFLWCHFILRHC